ncbi:MAG: trypsin-like peptidase domain-containing protein [Ignavibacteriae bacterium]|nr:trypsin-like peptidase domain-containing protein [Ignavibacteriota bacterium]MCB0725214.1 trypsin-like peptidase domain-containing protein [Ignavibacteriota bacterium]MCB9242462.1 trypsin-like peptidase domain-containing protein [Ignavibacteriales bacterium]
MKNLNTNKILIGAFIILTLLISLTGEVFSQLRSDEVHDKISGAIVYITSYDGSGDYNNQGSGVVVDPSGVIWTNFHLFDKDCRMNLEIDGTTYYNPKIIGANPEKDILILKLNEELKYYIKPVSTIDIKKGSEVYAYGNPFSISNTFSDGVLSNIYQFPFKDQIFLQYTASISGGSSGGALVNSNGELIGITCSSYKDVGVQTLNFAVRSDDFLNTKIISPDDPKAVSAMHEYCIAYDLYSRSDYVRCIDLLEGYIACFPDDANVYYLKGICYSNVGNYKKAIDNFTIAVDLNDHDAKFFRERGYSYMKDDKLTDASKDFDRSLNLRNNDPQTYFYLAFMDYEYLGYYDNAIKYCDKALELNYDDPYPYSLKGDIYLKKGDTISAMTNYYNSIYTDSTYVIAYEKLAEIYFTQRKYTESAYNYSYMIKFSQESFLSSKVFYRRAVSYKNSKHINKAIEDLKEALSQDYYDNDNYFTALGYCYIDTKDYESAKKELLKALEKNKKNVETYLALAIVSFMSKDFDEADEYMEKTVRLKPLMKKGKVEIVKLNNKLNIRLDQDQLEIVYELLNRLGYEVSYGSYFKNDKTADPAEK